MTYKLDPEDVDELIIYFLDRSNDKVSIQNDFDFQQALTLLSKELNFNKKYFLKVFLEVSEKSKLFMREMAESKVFCPVDEEAQKREQLRKEILERERQLKEIMEKERENREKIEREAAEKAKILKMEAEKLELEKIQKEKMKDQIRKSVTESVTSNFEKIKQEMINKAIQEALENFEKNYSLKDCKEEQKPIFIEDVLKVNETKPKIDKYRRLINEMRNTYDLQLISDEKLNEALIKFNGKVEEVLASLF